MSGAPVALALALAALGGPAPAGANAGATSGLEDDERRGNHHRSRHALALGPHATTFFSEEGSQYTFFSGSVGYLGSLGARGPFVHVFALLPLQARQDGSVYATGDYYRRRAGGDLLLGWQWRWSVRHDLEAEAGPGLHATLVYLPGEGRIPRLLRPPARPRRRSGPAMETGRPQLLAAHHGRRVLRRRVRSLNPLRADDLAHGFTFSTGLLLGLGVSP